MEDRLILLDGKNYPVLVMDSGIQGMDKGARDFLASEYSLTGLSAAAIMVTSEFSKFIANFFMKVNFISPIIPVRLFTNEKNALQWLDNFVLKNHP